MSSSLSHNRLSKILAYCGIASRRAAEEIIFEGRVTVNGEIERTPQRKVDLSTDRITVDGKPIGKAEEKVYFIFNKPKNVLCTAKREDGKKIVLDYFKEEDQRVFTVGRLDRDTTGLILITNDGHFANQVIHPSKGLTKEYLVKVLQEVEAEHLQKIAQGTVVEEVLVRPVKVTKVRRGTLKIVVKEGRKREVRSLVENAGLTIDALTRIRIGGLLLGDIPEGQYRPMTENEKRALFS